MDMILSLYGKIQARENWYSTLACFTQCQLNLKQNIVNRIWETSTIVICVDKTHTHLLMKYLKC